MSTLTSFDTSGKNYKSAKRKLILFFGAMSALALWQEISSDQGERPNPEKSIVYKCNGEDTTICNHIRLYPASKVKPK